MSEEKQLHEAMALAFSEIENASKDKGNPAFKANGKDLKYATLESVVQAIKPALIAHGLWFRQTMHERDKGVCVETIVSHKTGGEISFGLLFVPAVKQDAQGFGSALTYARRYSLMTAFGVCPEDDDGNAAIRRDEPQKQIAFITPDQWDELGRLASAAEVTSEDVLKGAKVAKWEDIPEAKFEPLKARLTKKIEELRKDIGQ